MKLFIGLLALLLWTVLAAEPANFIEINSVGLREVVVTVPTVSRTIAVPAHNVGWYDLSAKVGEGNTVLVGHNPGVFTPLLRVRVGDTITLNHSTQYVVTEIMQLPDKGQPEPVRRANGKWIQSTSDVRVTLITCVGNDRLIIVAQAR